MASWARIDDADKKKDPNWAHVDVPEETDQFVELADMIDKACEKYSNRKLDLDNFGSSYSDKKEAEFLWAYSGMQKCMGELSESAIDIFKGNNADFHDVKRAMGRMLFYMNAVLDSVGGDLTDAKDECEHLCRGVEIAL